MMKKRDRYLTGTLLILIGILIGTLFAFYQQSISVNDFADVEVTEIKHSAEPIFSNEELAKMDSKFLFKKIAERVKPTVVYVETVVSVDRSDLPDDEFHHPDSFWDFIPRRAKTVGSGVIISSDGYILTNNHVIAGAIDNEIKVVLSDKRTFEARVVGKDPTTDLAVLKIDARHLPAITFGNSNEVDVGEWVLAIGNPFRLRSTVTAGIVSALSRDVQIIDERMRIESFIQTDAAINKGNSGGALVNTSGELIGINTAIASKTGSYQGYGFAVPSNLCAKVAADLIEFGEVRRALLGVSIVSVNASLAEELNMDEIKGVLIAAVSPGSAADKHGLQQYDVILSIDGVSVNESNDLQRKIAIRRPGEIVDLKIWRDGKEFTKNVRLGKLDLNDEELVFENSGDDREIEFAPFDFGFRVMAVPRSAKSDTFDLVISGIKNGSKAAQKGLEEGFVIKKVGSKKVEDLQSLKDLIAQNLEAHHSVTIEVEKPAGDTELYKFEP
ncbi:MAG TPA: Do family serine endopeptidase [Balneolaceae bacterium]|nr:Do family serine endopeptidase [Balneolaceae bacterium]